MNHKIDEHTAHVIYSLSSLAHDSATMALECHSRQSLGEDVCRLILTSDFVELHFRLVSRSKFPDSMDASVNMLGARVHATPLTRKIQAMLSCAMRVGAVCSYPRSSMIRCATETTVGKAMLISRLFGSPWRSSSTRHHLRFQSPRNKWAFVAVPFFIHEAHWVLRTGAFIVPVADPYFDSVNQFLAQPSCRNSFLVL